MTGARVPLDSIATVSPVWDPGRIVRRNGVRTLTVRSWEGGVLPSQVLSESSQSSISCRCRPGIESGTAANMKTRMTPFPKW